MRFAVTILLLFYISHLTAQVNLTNSTLPILVIETNGATIPDEPKLDVQMGIIYNGPNQINNISDPFNEYDGVIGIELRGQTSQFFPKQPYGFETRDINGDNNNVSLLGMAEENDWVLHNPYSDKSLIRNVLAYRIGNELIAYAPKTRLCELVLNGNYEGIYVLTEKIKIDEGRVNIANLKPEDISGDELTGGYIIKVDKPYQDLSQGWASSQSPGGNQTYFYHHDPKVDELNTIQKEYIKDWFDNFESVLASPDFLDSLMGYKQYIDVSSFVDFFLINELSRNVDGYRLSTYLYKDKDSKGGLLKMGPIWDFNLAFGNADYCDGFRTDGWAYEFNEICNADSWLVPFWWERMLQDAEMREAIRVRWQTLRTGFLSDNSMLGSINTFVSQMEEAPDRNFQQWPILNEYVWPNSYVGGSYSNEIQFLKDWVIDRMHWMDDAIDNFQVGVISPEQSEEVQFFPNPFTDEIEVKYFSSLTQKNHLQIYDGVGRLILEQFLEATQNGINQMTINTDLASGIYFYTFSNNSGSQTSGKIIKH